jgi:hypothetical protein
MHDTVLLMLANDDLTVRVTNWLRSPHGGQLTARGRIVASLQDEREIPSIYRAGAIPMVVEPTAFSNKHGVAQFIAEAARLLSLDGDTRYTGPITGKEHLGKARAGFGWFSDADSTVVVLPSAGAIDGSGSGSGSGDPMSKEQQPVVSSGFARVSSGPSGSS